MKFKIYRVSNYRIKPCKQAFKVKEDWEIEIKDLKELLELVKQNKTKNWQGGIIISEDTLKIYDDYIE